MSTDTAAAELAWENEGGRLRSASPEGDAPQASLTQDAATTDTVALRNPPSSTPTP